MAAMAQRADDERRTLEFLSGEPYEWPYWPACPVKRAGGEELGWVTADYPSIVLRERPLMRGVLAQLRFESAAEQLGELGFFDPRRIVPEAVRPLYEAQVVGRFRDVQALVDAGWLVD